MANIEAIINNKLEQFTRLGKIAKQIQNKRGKKELLQNIYKGMAKIAIDLELVKDVIFDQHPNLGPLFESLIELYGPEVRGQ